jgi:phospholipid/cholesterol/gamma-HCH transport system substrate-binding protein
VGTVSGVRLTPGGKGVTITLRIYRQHEIHKDAQFVIEQSGFLGDQYVAIVPTTNAAAMFAPGDKAKADAPLDLQAVARSAASLLEHIDSAATNINDALVDARRTVLSSWALTNLWVTFSNFHQVSERSLAIVDSLDSLVASNGPSVSVSVSNLVFFSEQLNQSANALGGLLATNSPAINAASSNIESATVTLKRLVDGVQEGKGLAGKLLVNEQIAANVSQIVDNLNIATSNLNRLGLWGILWERKPPSTNPPASVARPLTSPKHSVD